LTIKDRQKIPVAPKSPQEHGSANFKIPTLKRVSNRIGDINAASHMGGDEDIIHIRGRHNPPPRLDLTTHAIPPSPLSRRDTTPHATTTLYLTHNAKIRLQYMTRAARHPPLGEGYEQAGSARVQQEMGQEQ